VKLVRYLQYLTFAVLLIWGFSTSRYVPSTSSHINFVRWNPQQDIIAATDGYTVALYDSGFQKIGQIVAVSDASLPVRARAMEWSPDGSKFSESQIHANLTPNPSPLGGEAEKCFFLPLSMRWRGGRGVRCRQIRDSLRLVSRIAQAGMDWQP
jgi:hypothetical protein